MFLVVRGVVDLHVIVGCHGSVIWLPTLGGWGNFNWGESIPGDWWLDREDWGSGENWQGWPLGGKLWGRLEWRVSGEVVHWEWVGEVSGDGEDRSTL